MTKNIVNSEGKSEGTSRRLFATGAGLAGLVISATRARAQSATPASGDIGILNFALTLEHLEANFYAQGLSRFKASDFSGTTFAQVLGSGTVNGVYANLGRIRDHEAAHVDAIRAAITSLGGTPVQACTYSFPYNTPEQFLQVALTLEETGVAAYDGAIAMLQTAALKTAGASIATVEARHASYLNLLNASIPFPRAFDQAKMMSEILALATPFFSSCPTGSIPGQGASTKAVLMPKNLTTVNRQITLDASQSMSGDGKPLKYLTRLISGSAALTMADTAMPVAQLSGGFGDYTFELTVTDTAGTTSTDRTTVRYAGV